jgi:zinc D-Ala-D-Ala dipeptidase
MVGRGMLEAFRARIAARVMGNAARVALLGAIAAGASEACSTDAALGETGPIATSSVVAAREVQTPVIASGGSESTPSAAAPASAAAVASKPEPGRPVPGDSNQLLLVTTSGWNKFNGVLRRYERSNAGQPWREAGREIDIVMGRRGLAWGRGLHPEMPHGPVKHEGDGRSPAGVFDLGHAYGYASAAPEGTTWPFARLTVGWRCVDEPRSEDYNKFLLPEGPSAEASLTPWDGVRRDVVFDTLVLVKHNTDPVVRGAGSCVLLHVWINPATPTQGCTGMSKKSAHEIVSWLSPSARPVLVQLPEDVRALVAQAWGIPQSR